MKLVYFPMGSYQANCYILIMEKQKEAVIIDPGIDDRRIEEQLGFYDCKPVAVLLTHGHFDHIGGVDALKTRYGCQVYAHEKEKEILESPEANLFDMFEHSKIVRADHFVKDGEELDFGEIKLTVIHTPGHTAGSCCFYEEEKGMLFSGDMLFERSYGRTDFPTGSLRSMVESGMKLFSSLPEDTVVYSGHGGATTIGQEKKNNPLAYFLRR